MVGTNPVGSAVRYSPLDLAAFSNGAKRYPVRSAPLLIGNSSSTE